MLVDDDVYGEDDDEDDDDDEGRNGEAATALRWSELSPSPPNFIDSSRTTADVVRIIVAAGFCEVSK